MRHLYILPAAFLMLGTVAEGGQHHWPQTTPQADRVRPITISPRAVIQGPSNGVYCPDMSEGAVGMHDLGWLPAGINLTINVSSMMPAESTFDPVATVVVASLGVPAANTVKATTFYDNDSGGGKDPRITFVTPQRGTYFLLVGENSGSGGGCYRYQMSPG